MESHLLQMRGLKHVIAIDNDEVLLVASFTDAWIETCFRLSFLRLGILCRIFYRCVD